MVLVLQSTAQGKRAPQKTREKEKSQREVQGKSQRPLPCRQSEKECENRLDFIQVTKRSPLDKERKFQFFHKEQ